MNNNAIINSALWAAYADALGFITEMADSKLLKRRAGADSVQNTLRWKRRIGGKFGEEVDFPAGAYSDDTQLRLATSRSIRGDGIFDMEAFAKIELPVWLTYSLGAGRSSKIAAESLKKKNITWFNNFFDKRGSKYINGGGNGAAMRIQPHVWSSGSLNNPERFLLDVIRNAICTHGHPRGILGAAFHALCLASALDKKQIPDIVVWKDSIARFPYILELMEQDEQIRTYWISTWEKLSEESIAIAFQRVQNECEDDLASIEKYLKTPSKDSYANLVADIGGLNPKTRGSGTKTAIIAAALSWMYRDQSAETGILVAINLLSSDTDTIATMAGALIGATVSMPPQGEIQDSEYIINEALRLSQISRGMPNESFSYPDLLQWVPPKTQSDSVGIVQDSEVLMGLAKIVKLKKTFGAKTSKDTFWQWMDLEFGQTILAKRKVELKKIPETSTPYRKIEHRTSIAKKKSKPLISKMHQDQPTLFSSTSQTHSRIKSRDQNQKLINVLTAEAIKSNFDPNLIGQHLVNLSLESDGIEKSIAYTAIISKAIIVRSQAGRD